MQAIYNKIYEIVNSSSNQSIFLQLGLEPIRTADVQRGQITMPERFELYPTPALFVGTRTKWSLEGKRYKGDITVEVQVVTDQPHETASFYTNNDEAILKLSYYKLVQQLLDGLQTPTTSPFIRVDDGDIDTGVVACHILTYQCTTYEPFNNNSTIEIDGVQVAIEGKQLVKSL